MAVKDNQYKVNALCRTYAVSGSCREWHVAVRMSATHFSGRDRSWSNLSGIGNYSGPRCRI